MMFCPFNWWVVTCGCFGATHLILAAVAADFERFLGGFLRDETGSGRGVHRFWHFLIQKPRSNFSPFYDFSHFSGIFGVGVV